VDTGLDLRMVSLNRTACRGHIACWITEFQLGCLAQAIFLRIRPCLITNKLESYQHEA
jgi:hypothetical protein